MNITANKLSWTNAAGDSIEVALTEQPRKVAKTETGPARDGYMVRGVARFVSGPCFEKYGSHPTAVDIGLTAAEVLAWHMAVAA